MSLSFDPLSKACKSITGAVKCGDDITFRVFGEGNNLTFVLWRDGEAQERIPMQKNDGDFTLSTSLHTTGLYFYYFEIGEGRYLSRGKLRKGEVCSHPTPWQLTIADKTFSYPAWLKGGIIYQIFPDRFFKAEGENIIHEKGRRMKRWGELPDDPKCGDGVGFCRDFFGGNLKGITLKLDYLKSLHVDAIYLNPIFKASSNHRYDTGDFKSIDPLLGTIEDFDELISEAKKRNISILLDGVFNHTGDDSIYFNRYENYPSVGAYQSKNSEYFTWYRFSEYPQKYDSWWGIESLPAVNEMDEGYLNFLFSEKDGVVPYWLRRGIGGFRLDVADELPDEFLKILRRVVKGEDPNAVILGEVWEDASDKISYGVRRKYLQGGELDSVMNYPLKDAVIDFVLSGNCYNLRETIAMLLDHYPKESMDGTMNLLGTHDTPRILTVLKNSNFDENKSKELLKRAALLEFTLPGIPCIYYGDEIGMQGGKDPDCRRCFDWEHGDEEILNFYRTLAQMRSDEKEIFSEGIYREIYAEDRVIVFARTCMQRSAYVFVNFSQDSFILHLKKNCRNALTGAAVENSYIVHAQDYGVLIETR